MPRVLIPSDAIQVSDLGLVEEYRSLGCDVAIGTANFKVQAAHYDVIHYHWPEEYCDWRVPTKQQIAQIDQQLRWWSSRSINVLTVHNLTPHYGAGHPAFHELYSCFFRHCHFISHFSHTSQRLLTEKFPAARQAQHVVHGPPSYKVILDGQSQRGSRRAEMGLGDDEFVILMIGRIRSWAEAKLIQRAFDLAKVPKKRLLIVGNLAAMLPSWRKRFSALRWNWWLKNHRAVVERRYVPENELSRFLDSSNVAIVPRFGGLNSGIVILAMTFGRMVIAPNCGAYPEQFAGSRNLLFEAGDAVSLASKLEEAAALDTNDIGRDNGAIAANWSWRKICRACLDAAHQQTKLDLSSSKVATA